MLRKLLILGVFAGASASVPILIEQRPDAVSRLTSAALGGGEAEIGTAVLSTSASPPERSAPSGRKVVVSADRLGHFEAEFRINGRRVDGLIDTGATYVAMNVSTARTIGISLKPSDFTHRVKTANGNVPAASAVISRISLGRVEARDVEAVVLEDRALGTVLVGMSFLKCLSRYEVAEGTLLLVQ